MRPFPTATLMSSPDVRAILVFFLGEQTLGLPNKTLEVFENANEAVISFQNEALSCVSVDLTSLTSLDADDFSSSIDDVQTLLEDAITDDVEGLANDVSVEISGHFRLEPGLPWGCYETS